jgi:hypothetical protein
MHDELSGGYALATQTSPFFEVALVLVRFHRVASVIVNANQHRASGCNVPRIRLHCQPHSARRTTALSSRIDSLENEFAVDCLIRVRACVAVRRFEGNFEVDWRSMQRTLVLIFQKNPPGSRVQVWLLT